MKKTILIVEDNLILCDILEKWLLQAGYEVITAVDEPTARQKNQDAGCGTGADRCTSA